MASSTGVADTIRIALIGDYDASAIAHRAIPRALALSSQRAGLTLTHAWLPTDSLSADFDYEAFDGVWCVPASPYRNPDGALRAIRFAREHGRPFLGTCGGFQHAILEYARFVLGWHDAEHGESAPSADRPVVSALACALVEVSDVIHLVPGSQVQAAYGSTDAREEYHCRYGLEPSVREALTADALCVSAVDIHGDVRAVELSAHPFFVATLFQPERAALRGKAPPLVTAFVRAAANSHDARRTNFQRL